MLCGLSDAKAYAKMYKTGALPLVLPLYTLPSAQWYLSLKTCLNPSWCKQEMYIFVDILASKL